MKRSRGVSENAAMSGMALQPAVLHAGSPNERDTCNGGPFARLSLRGRGWQPAALRAGYPNERDTQMSGVPK
eukprot:363433-Chlamydomonas_euryale.AAC.10